MYYVVAGQHPAFGYVDQPPLTPLLSAASVALLGVSPTAVRVLPALEMALIVVLVALMARDLGGSRRAQVLAAITAALSGYLAGGHLDTTSEPDLLAWAVILWLLVKLLAGGDRRLWLAVGVVTGIGLENKDTLLFLGAGLAVGLVLARRWDVVRSRWAWAAIGIALLIWAPNLAWQAANSWPQITMASLIGGNAADNRAQIVPFLWLFAGMLLFPVAHRRLGLDAAGARPRRPGGRSGSPPSSSSSSWWSVAARPTTASASWPRSWRPARSSSTAGWRAGIDACAPRASSSPQPCRARSPCYLTLPILPPATFATTSLPSLDPILAEQIGWPQFVATVEGVVAGATRGQARPRGDPDQRLQRGEPARAARHGAAPGLLGPQRVLGLGPAAGRPYGRRARGGLETGRLEPVLRRLPHRRPCRQRVRGRRTRCRASSIWVCTGLRAPWTTIWPSLRTIS